MTRREDHAHARLVLAFRTPVRRANLASACIRCERACEGERVCRAGISCRSKPPPGNALADLVLAPTDFGEQSHGIETAIGGA
jgi:hypothetical protein